MSLLRITTSTRPPSGHVGERLLVASGDHRQRSAVGVVLAEPHVPDGLRDRVFDRPAAHPADVVRRPRSATSAARPSAGLPVASSGTQRNCHSRRHGKGREWPGAHAPADGSRRAGRVPLRTVDGVDGRAAARDRVLAQRLRGGRTRLRRRRAQARGADVGARPHAAVDAPAGVALAVHFGTWVTALTLTSVASATALVCLQIAFVVAWEMLRGQHFGPLVLVGLVVAFAGVLIVSGVDVTLSHRALIGDLLALAGAVGGAAYIVVGSRVRQAVSTTTYTFGCYGSCALLLLVACLVAGQPLGGYPASQWVLLLTVTLTSHLFGHSVFNHLLANTSPTMVSLALLLEVPGASVLAAVILGQVPPPAAVLGLLVVLSGMALVVVGNQNAVVEQAPVD